MVNQTDRIWEDWEEYNHGLQGTATGSMMNQQGLSDRQAQPKPIRSKRSRQKQIKSRRTSKSTVSRKSRNTNDFNLWFGAIAFIVTGFYLYNPSDENGLASFIIAAVAALLGGKYWKYIAGVAIIIGTVFFLGSILVPNA